MQRTTFVYLSVLGLGLVLVSFLIRGFSQFVVPPRTAALLSAPTMLVGGSLVILLTLRSLLAVSGIRPIS